MTDQADTGPTAHRREGGHWLVFNEQRASGGPVTGCHCGFVAELDSDSGWGDSVLDHFEAVVRAESLTNARLSDVPGLERQLRDKIAGEIEADMAAVNWAPTFYNGMEWAASIVRHGVEAAARIARGVSS